MTFTPKPGRTVHDSYKSVATPNGTALEPCPVCGAPAELWRYSEAPDAPTRTLVTCSNGERFAPQDDIVNDGCLLYLPPSQFYRGTIREAVKYWNAYAEALREQRLRHLLLIGRAP